MASPRATRVRPPPPATPPAPPPALISRVQVEGYKSAKNLAFAPGRVTVLVGANGSGKSTILEAIALAAAAAADRLDNESLALRGVRASHPSMLRSGLVPYDPTAPIKVTVKAGDGAYTAVLKLEGEEYPKWVNVHEREFLDSILTSMSGDLTSPGKRVSEFFASDLGKAAIRNSLRRGVPALQDYLVYAPQVTTLRSLRPETHVEPLGVYGEGLFRLLRSLSREPDRKRDIVEALDHIEWFTGYDTVEEGDVRHIQAGDIFFGQALRADR